MKTAIYIEDGVVQLVLTPENEFEKNALRAFDKPEGISAEIWRGSFYNCEGGWVRHANRPNTLAGLIDRELEKSLIVRVDERSAAARVDEVDGGVAPITVRILDVNPDTGA